MGDRSVNANVGTIKFALSALPPIVQQKQASIDNSSSGSNNNTPPPPPPPPPQYGCPRKRAKTEETEAETGTETEHNGFSVSLPRDTILKATSKDMTEYENYMNITYALTEEQRLEIKRQKRLVSNREAAKKARNKVHNRLAELTEKVFDLENKVSALEEENRALAEYNARLLEENTMFRQYIYTVDQETVVQENTNYNNNTYYGNEDSYNTSGNSNEESDTGNSSSNGNVNGESNARFMHIKSLLVVFGLFTTIATRVWTEPVNVHNINQGNEHYENSVAALDQNTNMNFISSVELDKVGTIRRILEEDKRFSSVYANNQTVQMCKEEYNYGNGDYVIKRSRLLHGALFAPGWFLLMLLVPILDKRRENKRGIKKKRYDIVGDTLQPLFSCNCCKHTKCTLRSRTPKKECSCGE